MIEFNNVMERINKDLRRATADCINGLSRRRQRNSTLRNLPEFDRRMELQGTLGLRDRERFQMKVGDRNREFKKRRTIDSQQTDGDERYGGEIESRGSSDEEGEDALKIHHQNRRRIRTLRTSPELKCSADDIIGVPIPRRARSSLRKRLHDDWSSGGGGFTEDVENKKLVELNSCSDIEIEAAEALFELMKRNQPLKKLDRDSTDNIVDDELGIKVEVGGAEISAFSVQNEQSIRVDVDTSTVDSIEEAKVEKWNEKFQDEPTQELLSKEKVESQKESDSPSGYKVNACGIQDQTITKAVGLGMDSEAVMDTIKETKLGIDLMALPSLASLPERDLVVDMASDPKVMAPDRQEKGKAKLSNSSPAVSSRVQQETIGTLSSNQWLNLVNEKQPSKELKNQAPTSLLPFSMSMPMPMPMPTNGSTSLLSYPGYMRSIQPGLPIDGRVRSSLAVQPPPFKFSQPRLKRCATHENIARNIHYHHQLLKKSLVSGPTGSSNLNDMKSFDPNSVSLRQKFAARTQSLGPLQAEHNYATTSVGGGRDKRTEVATTLNTSTSNKLVPHQPPANNILHGPGFYYPFGGNPSLSSNLPGKAAASVNFNHPNVPPNESTPYVAILPKNGGPIPINQAPTLPVFSSSFYSSQSQQQLNIPHNLVQSVSQNTTISNSSSSHKPPTQVQQQPNTKINDNPPLPMNFAMLPHLTITDPQKSREHNPQTFAMSFGSNASTTPSFNFSSSSPSPPIFHMLHDISRNAYQMSQQSKFQTPEGKTSISFPNLDNEVKGKGILGKSPDSSAASSITIPNFQQQFNQDRFIQLQKHHMQNMNNNNNTILTRFAPAQTDNNSSSSIPQWINMPKTSQGQSQSHIPSFRNTSFQGHLGHDGQQILANAGSKPSQQVDASSSNGSSTVPKASSPACRRNVPSILTTCTPPQLSELKY